MENQNGIVIGYWESLLSELQTYIAERHLNNRHQAISNEKLEKMKQQSQVFHAPIPRSNVTDFVNDRI